MIREFFFGLLQGAALVMIAYTLTVMACNFFFRNK